MNLPAMITFLLSNSTPSHAALCEITIDRKPCPGRNIEAFQPYEGQNPFTETLKTKNQAICLEKAEKASKILRSGVVLQKTVSAKYDGKEIGKTFVGTSECK